MLAYVGFLGREVVKDAHFLVLYSSGAVLRLLYHCIVTESSFALFPDSRQRRAKLNTTKHARLTPPNAPPLRPPPGSFPSLGDGPDNPLLGLLQT